MAAPGRDVCQQHVSGVQTKCDALFVGFTREEVAQRMRACLADAARGRFPADLPALVARQAAEAWPMTRSCIRPTWSRPGMCAGSTTNPGLLGARATGADAHLDGSNPALVFMRQSTGREPYDHFLATRVLVVGSRVLQRSWRSVCGPLFVTEADGRTTNLSPSFLADLERLPAGTVG